MKICYEAKNLASATVERIRQANEIITEYAAQGFTLTLRQLYYQFVARAIISNNDREYKKLGDVIANGRMAGLIDWEAITDRTRFLRRQSYWNTPADIVHGCAAGFQIDRWVTQGAYCEVWIEKDALLGVIEGVCLDLHVPYLACRGYASASEVWQAGHRRLRQRHRAGKRCVILYLGDHDPSGLDMTRDVQARLDVFTGSAGAVEVRRLALNMDQVEAHEPPPNPTKMSDSRAAWYVDLYGETCWELDALEPAALAELISAAVNELIDRPAWQAVEEEEEQAKKQLAYVASNWAEIIDDMQQ